MIVTIDNDAKARLWAFIRAVKVEVGGMGYAFLQDDGSLAWQDTFLIPQEVTASEVDFEITGGDQHAIERAVNDGVLDDPRFVWVSWHSHHTMKAYWSSTDDKRIAAMNEVGVKRMLSLVGNHAGEYEMRFDLFGVEAHDVKIGQVTVSDVKFKAEAKREPSEFEREITAEVKQNVTEKKYKTYTKSSKQSVTEDAVDNSAQLLSKYAEWELLDEENEERRVVQELVETSGCTKAEAEELVWQLGVDEAEDLVTSYRAGTDGVVDDYRKASI